MFFSHFSFLICHTEQRLLINLLKWVKCVLSVLQKFYSTLITGSRSECLKMKFSCNPLTKYVIHTLNILLECLKKICERNTFFKTEKQFNDLMIDWSCVKIVKHLRKILFSEGWALWAKLDTSQKYTYVFAITQPSLLNSTNPNLSFAIIICKQLWKVYSSNRKKSFWKIFVSAF